MNIRFYIDPETGLPHIYNHDVEEKEVEDVLESPGEDRPGGDGHGSRSDRVAVDVFSASFMFVIRNRNSVFVITAYDLRGKPLLAYRRRLRKKGR